MNKKRFKLVEWEVRLNDTFRIILEMLKEIRAVVIALALGVGIFALLIIPLVIFGKPVNTSFYLLDFKNNQPLQYSGFVIMFIGVVIWRYIVNKRKLINQGGLIL